MRNSYYRREFPYVAPCEYNNNNNTHFQIQSYDTDWDAYVDVEDFSALADKSKLRCTNLTMTVSPTQSSCFWA